MCEAKRYENTPNVRIDKCIRYLIHALNQFGIKTVASCCGHDKYLLTIIVKFKAQHIIYYRDIVSGKVIERKRNFYRRDKQGYYYIPETLI